MIINVINGIQKEIKSAQQQLRVSIGPIILMMLNTVLTQIGTSVML